MIVYTPSSHANMVIETSIAPVEYLSVEITPSSHINEVMEIDIAPTSDLEPLIQEMSTISVIEEGSTNQRNIL